MFLFYRLLLAHLLADFPLQFTQLFKLKVSSRWGTAFHGGIFTLLALILAYPYLTLNSIWVFILLLGISHIFIDETKLSLTRKFKIDNLWLFLLDQGLHIGFIGLLAATSLGRLVLNWPLYNFPSFLTQAYNDPQSKVIIYIIAYLIATFGGTFLIYYLKKTFFIKQLGEVVISQPEKYFGILERFLIVNLVIFPGHFYFLIPIVLITRGIACAKQKHLGTWIDFLTSIVLAIIIGLILRIWVVTW
ncbi:DUF3307 domain-containing protein [bacterium]|nr:DUF3307 domain-containing protein [bacterium]